MRVPLLLRADAPSLIQVNAGQVPLREGEVALFLPSIRMADDDPTPAADLPVGLGWPIPPFFQAIGEPSSGHNPGCVVELNGDGLVQGELMAFEPERGHIDLQTLSSKVPRRIRLEQIGVLKLKTPFALVRDAAAIAGIRASDAEVRSELPFVASLNNGTTLRGQTCGIVRTPSGVFLYPTEAGTHQAAGWFLPISQIKELTLGEPLGNMLIASQAVSEKALKSALAKQAKLRAEPLGMYLASRAIVSPGELARVLKLQERAPVKKLGELLLEEELISAAQLKEALEAQRRNRERRLGDILVEMGAISHRAIRQALSRKLGIPSVDVREFFIEPNALRLLPKAVAMSQQLLPLMRIDDQVVVAMEDPLEGNAGHDVKVITGLDVVPAIASPGDLRARISFEYDHLDDRPPLDAKPGTTLSDRGPDRGPQATVDEITSQLAREAPVDTLESTSDARVTDNTLVRLVNKMILDAHAQGASDIHIESNPGGQYTRIRFRKDGDLEDYLELQPAYRRAVVSRIKIMAGLDISEHRQAQDGKISFGQVGPLPIDLRVAVIPTSNNMEDVVMRLLGGVEPLPLEQLGLSARDLSVLKQSVSRSYGLFLVCGPTGSGKTTTLHSVLHYINRPDLKIWTAEDPIEITQSGLRQVQINARIGWTFANAMRAFLRADPDVIMVGEMRDVETTKIGIEASLTGHLVLSTLHTNSAAESVVRLLDLGMDAFNFADALIGVLSQRLARKLCPKCKCAREPDPLELSELASEFCAGTSLDPVAVLEGWRETYGRDGRLFLYEPVGCADCSNGWRGRIGVYELLLASPELKHLIRSRGSVPQLVDAACAGGMQLLRQDALLKALGGSLDLVTARATGI